jgi:GTP cyclohydrolase I
MSQWVEATMNLVEWLIKNVTRDPRAQRWFDAPEAEERIVRCYKELLSGYELEPSEILKTTRLLRDGEKPGLVEINNIEFFSICAHHFLPFFGHVNIAYVPGDRILGLGKFPRLVEAYARRFQIQEDLVRNIAEEIMKSGHAKGVHVTSSARHLCMMARGPNNASAFTNAEFALGCLDSNAH